jgi:hypothetical protein
VADVSGLEARVAELERETARAREAQGKIAAKERGLAEREARKREAWKAKQLRCPGRPGRLSALSVSLYKSGLYGVFVWARRVLNSQKRRFPARAGEQAQRQVDERTAAAAEAVARAAAAEAASTKAKAEAEQVAFAVSEVEAETARQRLSEAEAEKAALLADAEADRALTKQLQEEARRLVQDRETMEQELRQKDEELQQAAREQLERSQTAWVTNKHSVELLKTESVTDGTGTHTVYHYIFDDPEHAGGPKVRKTLAQKLGQLQPCMAVFLFAVLECMGQLASFGPT